MFTGHVVPVEVVVLPVGQAALPSPPARLVVAVWLTSLPVTERHRPQTARLPVERRPAVPVDHSLSGSEEVWSEVKPTTVHARDRNGSQVVLDRFVLCRILHYHQTSSVVQLAAGLSG